MFIKFPLTQGILHVKHIKINAEAPTIIFLHDALGCVATWKNFPERLAEMTKCNYLVYDRLGHGEASIDSRKRGVDYLELEADILIQLIESLALKNVILFGHSDGGSIALIAASKYKKDLLGLVTEAAHVFVERITLQGVSIAKEFYAHGDLKEKLTKYHDSKTEALFEAWANTWLSEEFRNWNIEYLLSEVNCPALIIQGEQDEYGTIKQLEQIKKAVNAPVAVELLSNTGHTPHKEQTELVLSITSQFIKNLV